MLEGKEIDSGLQPQMILQRVLCVCVCVYCVCVCVCVRANEVAGVGVCFKRELLPIDRIAKQ